MSSCKFSKPLLDPCIGQSAVQYRAYEPCAWYSRPSLYMRRGIGPLQGGIFYIDPSDLRRPEREGACWPALFGCVEAFQWKVWIKYGWLYNMSSPRQRFANVNCLFAYCGNSLEICDDNMHSFRSNLPHIAQCKTVLRISDQRKRNIALAYLNARAHADTLIDIPSRALIYAKLISVSIPPNSAVIGLEWLEWPAQISAHVATTQSSCLFRRQYSW